VIGVVVGPVAVDGVELEHREKRLVLKGRVGFDQQVAVEIFLHHDEDGLIGFDLAVLRAARLVQCDLRQAIVPEGILGPGGVEEDLGVGSRGSQRRFGRFLRRCGGKSTPTQ
jgi:hypothetical protein